MSLLTPEQLAECQNRLRNTSPHGKAIMNTEWLYGGLLDHIEAREQQVKEGLETLHKWADAPHQWVGVEEIARSLGITLF